MATKKHNIKVGDKVRLTGKFLRSTGQFTSDEARKTWMVTAVDDDFLTTDELKDPSSLDCYTAEELAQYPSLRYRRINAHNVIKVGKPDHS